MRYKNGVYVSVHAIVNGIEESLTTVPEIEYAKLVAEEVSQRYTAREIVITAVFDGKHMKGSKHYTGEAFDIRIRHYTKEQTLKVFNELKTELGADYDVIHHKDSHIHIEFDPK